MIRRRDGEYRLREFDPATIHRLAVELLTAFAKDPGAAQIADLEDYLPDIKWLAPSDSERDDLVDAIYDACEKAVITIPAYAPHGHLTDADTGDVIGPATAAQRQASETAAGTGVFLVDKDGDPISEQDATDSGNTWAQPVRRVYVDYAERTTS